MRYLIIIFCLLLIVFSFHQAQAKIIHVPADSSTIQAGINGAVAGDTVLVVEGHYYEQINFYGKAILLTSEFMNDGDPLHIQNTIIDGDSSYGSVVNFSNYENLTSIIQGFTIQRGSGDRGGGICCNQSSPTITYCTITDNKASGGGGISCNQSSPTISYCTIINNEAFYWPLGDSKDTIADNTDNSGQIGAGTGGGILCLDSSAPTITKCTIAQNTTFVPLAGSAGGGISCFQSSPTINYSTIYRNVAVLGWGGGICCFSSSLSILNCTITHNGASDGGGVFCADCIFVWINNCILWNDSPDEIYRYPGMPSNVWVAYSDIEGGWLGGAYNIDCCPMFCNPNTDNYYLAGNSCCVGAGEGGVDIGAFGVGCPSYIRGDANGDSTVNIADVVYLINYLFIDGPPPDPLGAGDANCDGTIDTADVVYLINYLFIGGPPPCCP